jgi:hypothetical protein
MCHYRCQGGGIGAPGSGSAPILVQRRREYGAALYNHVVGILKFFLQKEPKKFPTPSSETAKVIFFLIN